MLCLHVCMRWRDQVVKGQNNGQNNGQPLPPSLYPSLPSCTLLDDLFTSSPFLALPLPSSPLRTHSYVSSCCPSDTIYPARVRQAVA
jgi:hypothetical protein